MYSYDSTPGKCYDAQTPKHTKKRYETMILCFDHPPLDTTSARYATGVMPTVHFIPRSPLCHDPLAATADNNADVNVAVVVPLSSLPNTKEIGEVGYKFRKQFGTMGWFTGTVVEIIPNAELGYDRRCVYTEDGDVEDLRIEDLVELAKLDDSQSQKNGCSMNGRQSPAATNHKESSSAKKRKCIKNTSVLTKIKSSKYSGISNSQREKIAMETLASYLVECGGMFLI
jgi:hypothetical protein